MFDLQGRLLALAQNLWWSWHEELDQIFRTIDQELWRKVNHNPIAFLHQLPPSELAEKESDAALMAQIMRVEKRLSDYLKRDDKWASWNAPGLFARPVAYFSFEFCIHECLPIYSGGLGVLAGDHLKSCSDLGVPAIGVTFLYRQGYFHQQLDVNGQQTEVYQDLDVDRVPIERVLMPGGEQLRVPVPVGEHVLTAKVWRARVGRCELLMLDVEDQPDNPDHMRMFRLYGGDKTTRLVQELVLGVGGYRALVALGKRPGVMHLNEGHCAFALLEMIAHHMEQTGMPFHAAAKELAQNVVFTTHTPVAAGHDFFDPGQALHYLRPMQARLGISDEELLGLGRVHPGDSNEQFCMTVLSLKLSRHANAVSSLHGGTSRSMWHSLWSDRATHEVPIGHITNGAHMNTWLAPELSALYADCLGADYKEWLCDARRWRHIEKLDEFTLWNTKVILKRRMIDFVLRRVRKQRERHGDARPLPKLRLDALTIGFARRFAMYKRAGLIARDIERLKRLLRNTDRPVQIIFAGKAHPADEPGKGIIRSIVELSHDPEFADSIVVLEDHDKNISRHLLEGCDLWLNSPRRPLEASGTSGMKAVFNATLNCSTLDGWWDEAYDGHNGFEYGDGLVHTNTEIQDSRDAAMLMDVLEQKVVPRYYVRNGESIPFDWLRMVKHALRTLAWRYNSDRMVMDYTRHMYLPASRTLTAEIAH